MERQLRMGGGIMSLEPRQQYGLGSFVKKAVKGVTGAVKGAVSGIKDFAKSDIGKAAMLAAISFGIPGTNVGGLFGRQSMFGPAKGLFGEYGIGNTFGALKASPFGQSIFGKAVGEDMTRTGGLLNNKLLQGAAAGTVLGSVLGGGMPSDEGETIGGTRNVEALRAKLTQAYKNLRYPDEEIPALVEADLSEYTMGAGGYANGGRIGFNSGSEDYESKFMKLVSELMEAGFSQQQAIEEARERLSENKAEGGRIGYSGGSGKTITLMDGTKVYIPSGSTTSSGSLKDKIYSSSKGDLLREDILAKMLFSDGGRAKYAFGNNPEQNAINAAGIMGLPLNQNPAGATELDMRDTGGFIPPVGVKEKEDDIPAMLSNNEFVFTADAVRGMGDGNVNVGAQRMYDMMKKLENGGRV